jgi:hypothetical protein
VETPYDPSETAFTRVFGKAADEMEAIADARGDDSGKLGGKSD